MGNQAMFYVRIKIDYIIKTINIPIFGMFYIYVVMPVCIQTFPKTKSIYYLVI